MKKKISIGLILLIIICITGNVYAVLECNINLVTEKAEYNKGDVFTVDVNISNIESDRGVISCGGTLEYDKDSLKLEKIEGVNGWETPEIGTSYNETNGKFVTTRNELGKTDESILKLTFTVNKESKQSAVITLKNVTLADGTSLVKINEKNKNITIKQGTQNPNPQPGDSDINNNPKPGNISNTSNDLSSSDSSISKKDNTITDKIMPKTGEKSLTIVILIGILIIISFVSLIKIKMINKQ